MNWFKPYFKPGDLVYVVNGWLANEMVQIYPCVPGAEAPQDAVLFELLKPGTCVMLIEKVNEECGLITYGVKKRPLLLDAFWKILYKEKLYRINEKHLYSLASRGSPK